MEVKEQKKQEEYSDESKLQRKGSKILEDKFKKKSKKKIIATVIGAKVIATGIIIAAPLSVLLFLAGADYVTNVDAEEGTNNAKDQSIETSYSSDASTTGTDEDGNTINKIVVTTNTDNTGYEIKYNNNTEYIKDAGQKLEKEQIINSATNFTDFEIAVLGALMEAGANLDFYTEEQLKCLPTFIKAEASTQNLDLRPNSEKFGGKEQISENYVPKKIEELEENEIPGTILVKRTNTSGTESFLEYIDKTTFEALITEKNMDVINKFTINEKGEIVFAKWANTNVVVSGEYPEKLEDSEKIQSSNENFITTESIAYSQNILEYKMPFELLNQLLITTEEPEFCMELVNYAMDSKIVINIQEEQTITTTTEEKIYDIHYKEEKKIDYVVGESIELGIDYLIRTKDGAVVIDDIETDYTIDDEGNECTIYQYNTTLNSPVTITTTRTEHTYKFEILEADTWLGWFKMDYADPTVSTEKIVDNAKVEEKREYVAEEIISIQNSEEILKDSHANNFKQLKEEYYKDNELKCNLSKLSITPYNKINVTTITNQTRTKSVADSNPFFNPHRYGIDSNGNYEKFLAAYHNSPGAQNALHSIDTWLFEMMAGNNATKELEDEIKLLLYMYDGVDRGVTELDLDILNPNEFTMVSNSGDIFIEFLKEYENGRLRDYMNGDSNNYEAVKEFVTQDRSKYKMVYSDFDGCLNFSYGIMVRNAKGTLNNVEYFANEGINLQSLIEQYDAGQDVYVNVEIIDRIYYKIVQDKREKLKERLEENGAYLKTHQIDALINVSYQYGNCGEKIQGENNIANIYNKYYETDPEAFKNKAVCQTGNGGLANFFVRNGSTREKYNWILFTEGRYLDGAGKVIQGTSSVADFAMKFVGENHSRFTRYNPINGVSDIWYQADWCAMFVSYCYNECGLIPSALREPFAGCSTEVEILKSRDEFIDADSGYIPQPGDIIFFTNDGGNTSNHTGIVVSCDGTNVKTVEGNTGYNGVGTYWENSKVNEYNYLLTSSSIYRVF